MQDALLALIAPAADSFGRSARLAPNRRHQAVLMRVKTTCTQCLAALEAGAPVDLLSMDIQSILETIGEISGETSPDEVLDAVFSRFCIGK